MLTDKHIIILLLNLWLGGAERQVLHLARHLVSNHNTRVNIWGLSRKQQAIFIEYCEQYGIAYKTLNLAFSDTWSWRFFPSLMRLIIQLRRAEPDIILAYVGLPNTIGGLVWKFTGAKLFIANQRSARDRAPHRPGWRLAIRWTPLYLANSEIGAMFLTNELGVKPERVHVIQNGVELPPPQHSSAEWSTMAGVSEGCFVGCMVANLTNVKDHPTLLKAWRRVIDQQQDGEQEPILLLAGYYNKAYPKLLQLVEELHLQQHVRFLEQVKDIAGLLQIVDIGLLISPAEGMSNALMEMMAAGLPVIATHVPGNREVVGDDYPYLVPVGDVEALADKILLFKANADLREAVGTRNRRHIETYFNLEQRLIQTTDFIQNALAVATQQ